MTVGIMAVQHRLLGTILVTIESATTLREQALALLSAYMFMTTTRLKVEPIRTEKAISTGVMYLKAWRVIFPRRSEGRRTMYMRVKPAPNPAAKAWYDLLRRANPVADDTKEKVCLSISREASNVCSYVV